MSPSDESDLAITSESSDLALDNSIEAAPLDNLILRALTRVHRLSRISPDMKDETSKK